ncbi:hypothetical protein CR513_41028, partial [Mucuna pruriens]
MVTIFIDTLPSPYYDKVVGSVTSNFVDLVVVGERIELGIRRGKLAQASSSVGFAKKLLSEKKKGKGNAILIELFFPQGKKARSTVAHASSPPTLYVPPYQSRTDIGVATILGPAQQSARRPPRTLTSILMTYT